MPRIILSNTIKLILSLLIVPCFVSGLYAQVCTDDLSKNNWNNSWVSCRTSANPNTERPRSHWVLYEFDKPQSIDTTHIWNANRVGESTMGIKEAVIDYSIDGISWTSLGTFSFPKGNEKASYGGFKGPDFGGAFVSKILFTVTQIHGDPGCVSLAEVQFNINPTACYGEIDACGVCNGDGLNTWYMDGDGDGLGDPGNTIQSCEQPVGFVSNANDPCDTGVVGWATVGPIFQDNGCTGCHGNNAAGGLNLTSYSSTTLGGNKCGIGILTGTTLVDIITTDSYDGCGTPFIGPSMNDRVGGNIDAEELALISKWIEDGAPEDCSCPIGTPDTDNDGFCDNIDICPDLDNSLIGTPCDDGLACTTQDVWQEDCNCVGQLIDRDNDGVCDTEDLAPDNPCTADGIVDGVEPPDWIARPENDCDQDNITVASGDLNDFSACVDQEGTLQTAECNCENNLVSAGGIITDFVGMNANEARAASGQPDGLFSGTIDSGEDSLTLQFPFMEVGEEICLTVGFNSGNGVMRAFLNNRLMTFNNELSLTGYQAQEFCFKALNRGVQTLLITEDGQGSLRVDGSTYSTCPCDGSDITDVACLANFSDIGWRELDDCSLVICEGQPLTLGTDRYETIEYQWRGPNGLETESSTLTFNPVRASDSGTYWVYYQNNSGCDLIKVIELTVDPAPPVTANVRQPACGIQNGEIVLLFEDSPDRADIEFSITGANGSYLTVADNLGSYTYSNLGEGDYDIWARWSNGDCPISLGSYTFENQPAPAIEIGPNQVICEGKRATLTAGTNGEGFTYAWSNGSTKESQNVRPELQGYADEAFRYKVTVTDGNNCSSTDKVIVTVQAQPRAIVGIVHPTENIQVGSVTFTFPDHPTRKKIEFTLEGQLGSYQQMPDDAGSFTYSDLPPGSYHAWVRWDDTSCPVDLGEIILKDDATCPVISAKSSREVVCEGEAVKLKVIDNPNWTYAWSNGATTASQIIYPTLSNYANQVLTYGVTVTDENGCSRADQVDINVLSTPRISSSYTNAHCDKADGTITLSFEDHPSHKYMEYSITGIDGPYKRIGDDLGSHVVRLLPAGGYNVWVRWRNDSCPVKLGKINLENEPGPQIDAGPDLVVCESTPFYLSVKKDKSWTYLWSNNVTKSTQYLTASFKEYSDRTIPYSVKVKDEFGCKATDEINVRIQSKPRAKISKVDPHCGKPDGSITLRFKDHPDQRYIEFSVNGPDGKYRQVKDNKEIFTIYNLYAGNYNVWARWEGGSCPTKLGKLELRNISGPVIDAGPNQVVCEGTPFYLGVKSKSSWTYLWSNGVKTPSQSLTVSLDKYRDYIIPYTVKVKDRFGCKTIEEVIVRVESKPRAKISKIDPSCGNEDGSIVLSFDDHPDKSHMEFSINGPDGTYTQVKDKNKIFTFQNLPPGNYKIWARWTNGTCQPVNLGKTTLQFCSSSVASQENVPDKLVASNATEQTESSDADKRNIKLSKKLEQEKRFVDLSVFPNPLKAGGTLNIKYYTEETGRPLKILGITGQLIREIDADLITMGWNDLTVDLESISTGTFIIMDGFGNYKKFVVIE